ncbi:hypothetical protein [Stygiolobus caldivivus]|uniref:Uncharacterized protein n=1 Tax=Stygiolobus caldivivus TaxID=2824673 RepID=A0A8D5ZJ34_9CREN|nr:hypothetical protein [Stygiolobus caldivivus]BCU70186.1 hypothetical protein KN1_14830 [Stygiolobus caldivivus]
MSSGPDQQGQNNNNDNKKTITVRGIDSDLYTRIVNLSRQSGKTVGEIMNQAMSTFLGIAGKAGEKLDDAVYKARETGRAFIEGFNEAKKDVVIVSDVEELNANKNEIVAMGKPVSFRNIKKLVLEDIDDTTFDKYIDSIISVDELVIPRSLNKFKVLQKCRFVKRITQVP